MKKLLIVALLFVGCGPAMVLVPIPGPSGTPGQNGTKGDTGSQGAKGDQGAQGNPGIDASASVYTVQLCRTCTPAYPSTFPEIGICIKNQLYGAYSIPGAFLTLIPPGTYSSVGISCSCTVVVSPNCVVSN